MRPTERDAFALGCVITRIGEPTVSSAYPNLGRGGLLLADDRRDGRNPVLAGCGPASRLSRCMKKHEQRRSLVEGGFSGLASCDDAKDHSVVDVNVKQ